MPTPATHLTELVLEQIAEGTLPAAEEADARAHLDRCGRCAAELESYQHLFAMLGELPRFGPSPAFNDAVMARVLVQPQESFAAAWLKRLSPKRRRGWVLLGTIVTAPALPVLALVAWVLTQPLLSPATLWQWTLLRTQSLGQAALAWMLEQAVALGALDLGGMVYSAFLSVPASALGGVVALLAVGIPLSGWALVRLTRIPDGSVTYAR